MSFFRFTGSYMLDSSMQLENFIEAIYDWFKLKPSKDVTNWMSGFNLLKKAITATQTHNQKVVIFLDEVSWIDKKIVVVF